MIYLQDCAVLGMVGAEAETPAMGSLAPPPVILTLSGVLPCYSLPPPPPRAHSLERTTLL